MKARITLLLILMSQFLQAQLVHGYRPATWAYLKQSCDSLKRSPLPTQFTTTWRSQPQALLVKVKVPVADHAAAAKLLETKASLETFANAFPSASMDTVRAAVLDLRYRGNSEQLYMILTNGLGGPTTLLLPMGFPANSYAAGHIDFDHDPAHEMLRVRYYLTDLAPIQFADRYQSWLAELESVTGGLHSPYLPDAKPGHPTLDIGDLGKMTHAEKLALLRTHRSQIVRSSCMDGGPRSHLHQMGILAAEVHDFPLWLLIQFHLLAGNFDAEVTVDEDIESAKEMASILQELGLPVTRWLFTLSLQSDSWGDPRPHIHPSWIMEMHVGAPQKDLRPLLDKMLGLVADEELDGDNRASFYNAYRSYIRRNVTDPAMQEQELARLAAAASTLLLNP